MKKKYDAPEMFLFGMNTADDVLTFSNENEMAEGNDDCGDDIF